MEMALMLRESRTILLYATSAVIFLLVYTAGGQQVRRMTQEDDEGSLFASFQPKIVLAKHFQSNMVLQRAPSRTQIYGFGDGIGQLVQLKMITSSGWYTDKTHVAAGPGPLGGMWSFMLPAMPVNATVNFTIESSNTVLTLENIIFGDVWICSGQSNMVFPVRGMFNASQEMMNAHKHPNVRIMTVAMNQSDVPLYDFNALKQNWSLPDYHSISFFSAVCWLYGRHINEATGIPMGLIASHWGGTSVKVWSSPDALKKCDIPPDDETEVPPFQPGLLNRTDVNETATEDSFGVPWYPERVNGPARQGSSLWNAMIHPLVPMTISGAIWYQGEADAIGPYPITYTKYDCAFPAMIADWRTKFSDGSFGQTNPNFPFGFVQLAPNRNDSSIDTGFPDIRWRQTADLGYTPNAKMPHVFMAVAMDLPDFTSPHGSIHPRHKLEIGYRLSLGGLTVAYNRSLMFQGPLPEKAYLISDGIRLDYGNRWTLNVRNIEGFEIWCPAQNSSLTNGTWVATMITSHTDTTVTLQPATCEENSKPTYLRYAWRESPCLYKDCAVYSTTNELPAPPFLFHLVSDLDTTI